MRGRDVKRPRYKLQEHEDEESTQCDIDRVPPLDCSSSSASVQPNHGEELL